MTTERTTAPPRVDHGFFGPGSVTWKVWGYPTSPLIGFQRAVVIEEFDPFLLAAVDASQGIYRDPVKRYDRTVAYFATVAFGDSRSAIRASEILMRVHAKQVGTEPVSGRRFDANDPASQLWIHVTAWQSILLAYERYGPGPLPPEEEAAYWAQCAVAAELQTCDPADVPRSRDEVRAYYDRVRPRLCVTDRAKVAIDHLLAPGTITRDRGPLRFVKRPIAHVVRAATIATMPSWMRAIAGLEGPAVVDAAVVPVARAIVRAGAPTRMRLRALAELSPSTVPIVAPAFRGQAPLNDEVLTPAEARERYGRATVAETA